MKCLICGRLSLPGAKLCLDCKSARKRAFDATVTQPLLAAARRAPAGTDWLGLSSRGATVEPLPAPAASSKGWVAVASNARLRADLQSRHSFAPGRLCRPQIWHLIAGSGHSFGVRPC